MSDDFMDFAVDTDPDHPPQPSEEQMVVLREYLCEHALLTGSTVFGEPGCTPTAQDWLIDQCDFENAPYLELAVGFKGYGTERAEELAEHWVSYRFGTINMIVSRHVDFTTAWLYAHNSCCLDRPATKQDRHRIFIDARYAMYKVPNGMKKETYYWERES